MKARPIGIPVRRTAVRLNIQKMLKISLFNALSFLLFFVLAFVLKYRYKVISKNLRNCFPVISVAKEQKLIRSYYRHMADLVVEPFMINSLKMIEIHSFIQYENISVLNQPGRGGKDIVLMMSHYGNWEYLFSLPLFTDYEVFAVYSPISNSFLDKRMKKLRAQFGVKLVTKADWCRYVLKRKSTKPSIFIMIADQRPVPPFKHSVHFLGQKTYVQAGVEKIARKLGCAIVYLDPQKTKRHCYKYRFELLSEDASLETPEWILGQYYAALEKTILREPELWLWSHDRWKNHEKGIQAEKETTFSTVA